MIESLWSGNLAMSLLVKSSPGETKFGRWPGSPGDKDERQVGWAGTVTSVKWVDWVSTVLYVLRTHVLCVFGFKK